MTNQERGWGMSIDARINRVDVNHDGSGTLYLVPRPADGMGPASVPGQSQLRFLVAPRGIHRLVGKNVWGGTGDINLGARKIADRAGYEMLVFVDDDRVEEALRSSQWNTRNQVG